MEQLPTLEEIITQSKAELGAAAKGMKELTEKFGSYDEVVTTQKQTIDAQQKELDALKTRFDEIQTAMNRTDVGALSQKEEQSQLRTKEFCEWAMRGKEYDETRYAELGDFEKKMLSSDNLRTGGHWMPTTMYNKILEAVVRVDPFRQIANVVRLQEGDTLEGIYESGTLDASWTTERATVTESTTPETDKWEIATDPMYVYPRITQKMARLSAFDVEAWLMGKYTKAFSYLENYAFLRGTGVDQPRGLMTVAAASTNIGEGGAVQGTMSTGSTPQEVVIVESGAAATISDFDCLKAMKASLYDEYQGNASWIMNRGTYLVLDQLTDAVGHYLLQPDLSGASEGLLLGRPINFMWNMDAVGAGLYPIAYGDFQQAYTVVDAPGAFVVRDEATDFGRVVFKTERLGVGGDVVNYDAFCALLVEA